MKKALSALVLVALFAACGNSGSNGSDDTPEAPGSADATSGDPSSTARPAGVKAAPRDGINRPIDGSYVYAFDGSSERPSASPVQAPEDAEFTSKVTNDGDKMTTADQTSIGTTVSTTAYQWGDDAVSELSIETKSNAGTVGCKLDEPVDVIRIPIKKGEFGAQTYKGTGVACDRTKDVNVLRQENVEDAEGRSWSTWVFEVTTVGKSPGLTEEFTETKWFSADLGKDIKTEVETVGTDAAGKEAYRAQTSTLLKSYPT
jgi:hypothetical protein